MILILLFGIALLFSIALFIASVFLIITGVKMDDTEYLDVSPILIVLGVIGLIASILLLFALGCSFFYE